MYIIYVYAYCIYTGAYRETKKGGVEPKLGGGIGLILKKKYTLLVKSLKKVPKKGGGAKTFAPFSVRLCICTIAYTVIFLFKHSTGLLLIGNLYFALSSINVLFTFCIIPKIYLCKS